MRNGSKWQRLRRGLFYWLIVPLTLFYLGSNILLNSEWVRGRVVRSLEARSGENWEIGTLNWTPNGHVHVRDIHAELGDGELTIEHILLKPNWNQIRQKKLGFVSIEVESPSLDVSQQWLLSKVGKVADPASEAPVLANNQTANQPGGNAPAAAVQPDSAQPDTLAELEDTAQSALITGPKIEVKPSAGVVVSQEGGDKEYDAWLRVSDASFRLRNSAEGSRELFAVSGVFADIPYGGTLLEGTVRCAVMRLLGHEAMQDGSIVVQKKGPTIGLKETDVELLGVTLKPELKVLRGLDGMYFVAGLRIPQQDAALVVKHLDLAVGCEVQQLQMNIQGGGRIDKPLTWRGLAAVNSASFNVVEGHRGSLLHFDTITGFAHLNRGVLRVPSVELRGEDISVMGNGVATMNAVGFGVVRVVGSPEKKGWIEKFCDGSHFFEERKGALMRPLNTVDRYYMDVMLDGSLFQPMMKVDQASAWQPVWPAVGRLKKFVREERAEEGLAPAE